MGIYDNNLKKTNLGYQFDRNVYIGIQTNDNRVVTFKDLGNAIVASGGGGEDIQLQLSSIEDLSSSTNPAADHLSFHRDGQSVEYDILPQYVRAADSSDLTQQELQNAKACLLIPVEQAGTVIGFKIYYASGLPMQTLQLVLGNITYTYNGSAAVTVEFDTIPTVAASSVGIVTEIPDSDSSTDIPTAGAVHKFAASAGSLNMTEATAGYLVGVQQQPTTTTQTLAPVGSNTIKWADSASNAGAASQWLSANITGKLDKTLSIAAGSTIYTFDGSVSRAIQFDTIPTVAASSVAIVDNISTTSGAASSTNIPTEGAVYKFAAAAGSVKATASAAGYILGTPNQVTATTVGPDTPALSPIGADTANSLKWADTAASAGSASKWVNANITGKLDKTLTIAAGSDVHTFDGSANTSIQFDALPTVAASSVAITDTVPASATSTDIPTAGAVYNAIQTLAPGIGGIATAGSGNAVTQITYNATDKTLTVTSGTTFLTDVTYGNGISVTGTGATRTVSLNAAFNTATLTFGGTTSYAVVGGTTYNIKLPALPNFTVMGQQLNTGTHTVAAGAGLKVTTSGNTSTVSLDASFEENTTLVWGTPVSYAKVGATTHYMSLPSVNTIPTVAASSTEITSTVNSSSTAAQIPTAQGVYNAITSNIATTFSYDASTGILTIKTN